MLQKTFMDLYKALPESAKIVYVMLQTESHFRTGPITFEFHNPYRYLSCKAELVESIDRLEEAGLLTKEKGDKYSLPGLIRTRRKTYDVLSYDSIRAQEIMDQIDKNPYMR